MKLRDSKILVGRCIGIGSGGKADVHIGSIQMV